MLFDTKFEHVIVDSPAGQYGADGIVIAARCGVSLVVARRDTSRIGSLQALVQNLGATGAQVAGVVTVRSLAGVPSTRIEPSAVPPKVTLVGSEFSISGAGRASSAARKRPASSAPVPQ